MLYSCNKYDKKEKILKIQEKKNQNILLKLLI